MVSFMKKQVSKDDIAAARMVNPTCYLETKGFKVGWDSARRHASIRDDFGDEVYRVTRRGDGQFVYCDRYANKVGQYSGNIDLVLDIEEVTFQEAVLKLLERRISPPASCQTTRPERRPSLPSIPSGAEGAVWINKGRDYLRRRGISPGIIEKAERQMVLTYARDGVFFLGRDESGAVRNAAWRATNPAASVSKRDLAGSDKYFPPVFRGNQAEVIVAEGGADALAAWQRFQTNMSLPPTVIVSGGARVSGFLGNPVIQDTLAKASRITVLKDREKTEEIQAMTDAAHEKQRQKIMDFLESVNIRTKVRFWISNQYKDMADEVLAVEKLLDESSRLAQGAGCGVGFTRPLYWQTSQLMIPPTVQDDFKVYQRDNCWLFFDRDSRLGETPAFKAASAWIDFTAREITERDILASLAILSENRGEGNAACAGPEPFKRKVKELADVSYPGLKMVSLRTGD